MARVPVYNGKHLSYGAQKVNGWLRTQAAQTSHSWRDPRCPSWWRLPLHQKFARRGGRRRAMVGVGQSDAMDYHAWKRCSAWSNVSGGETGVKSVQMIDGDAVWKAGEEVVVPARLLETAAQRSDSFWGFSDLDSRTQDLANNGELPRLVKNPSYLVRTERRPADLLM